MIEKSDSIGLALATIAILGQAPSELLREALNALIERESARRLARMGGTEPQLQDIPRRRDTAE